MRQRIRRILYKTCLMRRIPSPILNPSYTGARKLSSATHRFMKNTQVAYVSRETCSRRWHIFPHLKTIIPPHMLSVKSFHEINIIHFYEYDYAATTFALVDGLLRRRVRQYTIRARISTLVSKTCRETRPYRRTSLINPSHLGRVGTYMQAAPNCGDSMNAPAYVLHLPQGKQARKEAP